jgi:hypothetical protein
MQNREIRQKRPAVKNMQAVSIEADQFRRLRNQRRDDKRDAGQLQRG